MSKKSNILTFSIIGVLSVPAIWALLHPGFFPTDDGNWMIIRLSAFYEALRQGEFPVRFLPRLNHGYGYPVADFLYPGFMYAGVIIHILGIGFVTTVKIILGVSIISSGIFTYFWLRKYFSALSAIAGAILYIYFPYHLWDVYHRGSVGEVLALAIAPFILWQFEIDKKVLPVLALAFLILAHNTLALLFLPIIIGYLFFVKKKTSLFIITTLLYAIGSSAFFWLPALYDKQFTVFDAVSVSDPAKYFVTDPELIGLGCIISFFLSFWILFKKGNLILYYFLIVLLLSLFLSSSFSHALWESGVLTKFVQFPFRFLSIAVLASSFILANVVSFFTERKQWFFALFFIGISFYSAWGYMFPKTYQQYPEGFYTTNEDTTTVKNEYMPKWVKEIPSTLPKAPIEIINGDGIVSTRLDKKIKIQAVVISSSGTIVQVNKVYFPGWQIALDYNKRWFSYDNPKGLIRVNIPAGTHVITAMFSETPFRVLSDIISLVSIIMLLFYQRFILQVITIFRFKKRNYL